MDLINLIEEFDKVSKSTSLVKENLIDTFLKKEIYIQGKIKDIGSDSVHLLDYDYVTGGVKYKDFNVEVKITYFKEHHGLAKKIVNFSINDNVNILTTLNYVQFQYTRLYLHFGLISIEKC